jgi:3-phenylpropionate/trans-cinnamate dioxygenase ferredoxin reductase subunit
MLKTSAPDVFAAGDIARYPEPRLGQPVRVEHWVVAERQGQAAARAMVGRGEPYRDVPFFWSLHHDVNLGYIGHAAKWDRIEVRGSLEARDALVVYWLKGEPHAVVTVDRDHANLQAEAALERGGYSALEALLKSGTV